MAAVVAKRKAFAMSWKSSSDRYGRVAVAIHWISATGIVGLIASGFLASGAADPAAKVPLLRVHALLGGGIVLLTVLRLLWWLLFDQRPHASAATPRWQQLGAGLVHKLFYAVTLVLGFSGFGILAASGLLPQLFAADIHILPHFHDYPARLVHGAAGRFLLVFLAFHVGAALFHQFVMRDRLLARMGVGI